MLCPKCGVPYNNNQKFCTVCGTPIAAAQNPVCGSDLPKNTTVINKQFNAPEAVFERPTAKSYSSMPILTDLDPKPEKPVGIGRWFLRILLTVSPLLVTYILLFLSELGCYSYFASLIGVSALALILLIIIGLSVAFQLTMLALTAFCKKVPQTSRNWAVATLIFIIALSVVLFLADVGFSIFTQPEGLGFTASYFPSILFVKLLFLAI